MAVLIAPKTAVPDATGLVAAINGSHIVELRVRGQPGPVLEAPDSQLIVASAYSADGNRIAMVTEGKSVLIWSRVDNRWSVESRSSCQKRATDVCFDDEGCLVLSDKAGDVFRFDLQGEGGKSDPELIAGHVSMLTAVEVCQNGTRLISADRDDKIRVSRYPRSWNIEGYCLGHREFVSGVVVSDDLGVIVSCAGDQTLRLWDVSTCRNLDTCLLNDPKSDESVPRMTLNPDIQTGDDTPSEATEAPAGSSGERVRCLTICKPNLVAASVDDDCIASILTITDGKLVKKIKIVVSQKIESMSFSVDGILWISCPGGKFYAVSCKLGVTGEIDVEGIKLEYDWTGLEWIKANNSARKNLSEYVKQSGDFGVGEYFERKQARIHGQTKPPAKQEGESKGSKINRNKRAKLSKADDE